MRSKRKRVIVSVFCGLLAAALMAVYASSTQKLISQSRSQNLEAYGGEQVEVFIASRNIAAGEKLTHNNVTKRLWLADLLPAGAMGEESDVIGQILGVALLANEPVVSTKLGSDADRISVPEGYCAVSIPTSDVLAVGGTIGAGSVIAIYAADRDTVRLLAAEVLVLDTSGSGYQSNRQNSLLAGGSYRQPLAWVTLSIREDMVEEIIAASRSVNLYLVLPGGGF
jgi:pilus assembly protein CpaB